MPLKQENAAARLPEPFTVGKGFLRANVDLYWNHLEAFEAACAKALGSGNGDVELDLTDVSFISSSFLGCLDNLLLQAGRLKKRVTLKVTQDVSWLFDIMGARRNLDMRVA